MSVAAIEPRSESIATVVLAQEVKDGLDAAYEAWQGQLNDLVQSQAGFLGTEVIRPVPGVQREWVVVYRFDGAENLRSWLDSPERARLLEEGHDLFVRPAEQMTMSGGPAADAGVTLVVQHQVKPGCESTFREIMDQIRRTERSQPGCLGSELLPPVPGVEDDWTSLVRFDTREHLDRWIENPERVAMVRRLEPQLSRLELRKVGSSFGSWFSFDMDDGAATPNWKQALTVLLTLYPTVMALHYGLTPLLDAIGMPFWLSMFVGNVVSIVALTWLLMPLATRALQFWLRPTATRAHTAAGLAMMAGLYALSLLGFAALP